VAWQRYVAIGDSSTEGIDDPDGEGGYRGWADRLAERLASAQAGVEYANLAVRGRTTPLIRAEQLEPALALRPDLMTVATGINDMLRPSFDPSHVRRDLEVMLGAATDAGATVVTVAWPDPSQVHPAARLLRRRVVALNHAVRAAAARSGALLLDLAREPVAGDPRLWSEDRLHANAEGHERIAAALAHLLDVDGSDDAWTRPLGDGTRPRRAPHRQVADDLVWARRHLAPWVGRRVRRRSSGDEVTAKRPRLRPVEPGAAP
jgi:lysophospholipase L1-like esterase